MLVAVTGKPHRSFQQEIRKTKKRESCKEGVPTSHLLCEKWELSQITTTLFLHFLCAVCGYPAHPVPSHSPPRVADNKNIAIRRRTPRSSAFGRPRQLSQIRDTPFPQLHQKY